MEKTNIFTEEPEQELWRSLLQFSYKANIHRFFEDNQIEITGEEDVLANCIAGALLQANEYYKASKMVSLQVLPLLLYYGTTNLFYAMSVLMTGSTPEISNHGMHIVVEPSQRFIADTGIKFDHYSDGAIHSFAKRLGTEINLCEYQPWELGDFFDSIAEIKDDYDRCYQNKTSQIIPLNVVKTPEGIVEKIYIDDSIAIQTLSNIEGFSSAYLTPQRVADRNKKSYMVLRHKMNGRVIHQTSYSGQPYLQVGHTKGSKVVTVPRELNMYIALFVLGFLCRYHPEKWNPFVTQDSTGEKLLVEKLLYYSRRMLPNIVLNRILGSQISFVSDKYIPEDRIHLVGEHEVREIVSNEVQTQIKKEMAQTAFRMKKG